MFAPFAPFLSDRLYKNLMDDQNGELSVHLCDMPKSDKSLIDEDLEAKMVHLTISQGRFLRQKYKIRFVSLWLLWLWWCVLRSIANFLRKWMLL